MGAYYNKKFITFFLLLFSIGAVSVFYFFVHQQKTTGNVKEIPQVKIIKAEKKTLPLEIKISGSLKAVQSVDLIPRIDGFIRKVNFQDGQFVKTGDLLFLLDDDYLQAQLSQAKAILNQTQAQLKDAERQYRRGQIMAQKGVFSQAQVETLESNAKALEAQLQANQAAIKVLEVQVSYTRLLSPIDGMIGINNFTVGNFIQAAQNLTLVTVADISSLQGIFGIPERYLGPLLDREGKNVKIELKNINGEVISSEASLLAIDNKVSSSQGIVNIEIEFKNIMKNGRPQLLPGQFVSGVVKVPQAMSRVIVPIEATHEGQKGSYTYIYDPKTKKVHYQQVDIGTTNAENAVILKGINEGDLVVTAGYIKIFDGAVVEII
jgi:RND family efflux transporter MFP subunit